MNDADDPFHFHYCSLSSMVRMRSDQDIAWEGHAGRLVPVPGLAWQAMNWHHHDPRLCHAIEEQRLLGKVVVAAVEKV